MAVAIHQTPGRHRLLLASDRSDGSSELARILGNVGDVGVVPTSDIPETPEGRFSGIVVDIDLRSAESVQRVRRKLIAESYQFIPRLFVVAEALHHGTMQAWALGATDTIQRPFEPRAVLDRLRAVFPESSRHESGESGQALSKGVAAAHLVMVKIFQRMPAGTLLTLKDVTQAETHILNAIKKTSLRHWLSMVGRHHDRSYRHCLFVTGFAVAFAQHLGMRESDQRRLVRAALLHDVGKAFIPVSLLEKPGKLTEEETEIVRRHPQLGFEALADEGDFPPEMLDVVLHHHEYLDGTGYPHGLTASRISDIVRLTTIVDVYAALVEERSYRLPFTRAKAFSIMEEMGGRLDQQLVQAFRPVALGI